MIRKTLLLGTVCGLLAAWGCAPWRGSGARLASPQATARAWDQHVAGLKARDDVVRLYTFDSVTVAEPTAPSLAGENEPLRYVPRGPLEVVEGRFPGKKAVRLDKGAFEAKPFAVKEKSFTVEMWFRKHGQGAELGNGRTNGMLFAQGDGYWDGMRVFTSYPSRQLRFAIGRPKPGHSFSFHAGDSVPDKVWHHLAATWDGREMRLYLNGLLLGRAPYAGDYTAPDAPFRVGFADAGIGSVRMDVDEVVVYRRALSAAEVLRSVCFAAPLSAKTLAWFDRATEAVARRDWAAASVAYQSVARMRRVGAQPKALARLGLARTLDKQARGAEAVKEYAAVCNDANAPEGIRQLALRMCARSERGVPNPMATRSAYEQLLAVPGLSDAERAGVRLNLAECCLREGDPATARKHYAAMLDATSLSEMDRWNVRLQMAHAHLVAKDYTAARAAYTTLAAEPTAPPAVRSYAILSAGHACLRAKDTKGAVAEFSKLKAMTDAPKHHRQEAAERIEELQRVGRGLPARDPKATRVKIPPFPTPAVTLHVAPTGADSNPGSAARPLATLEGARDAIRKLKAAKPLPAGGVTVMVHGGTYKVTHTFELAEGDSGTKAAPIVYRAAQGERPVFTGGVRIKGFTPVTDAATLARLPESARGKVMQADLKAQGITDLGAVAPRGYGLNGYPCNPWADLYVDGKPMQLGRWPNDGFVKVGEVHGGRFRSAESKKPGVFEYEGDRPARWTKARDAWVFGCWGHLWAGRCVGVASIDTATRRIATAQGTSYGFRQGQPYYCFNLLEEIDEAGEWYLDRDTGIVYLYPPTDLKKAVVEFPLLNVPFVKMDAVSHVTLRGLTFDLGRAEGLVTTDGERLLLAGCTFGRLGANGLVIQGGSGHGVLGCDIHTLGAGGIRMRGGDRARLTPSGHFVENCHIHNFSRVDRAYTPAVILDGVGIRVAHNLFHDSPHHAMRAEGYEHQIEFNEIHSVVYESDDQAGIDMWGNPAYRGHVMRYNFWHHIGSGHQVAGQSGIRLDDMISNVLMYGNVFYRCAGGRFGGIQIHGGKDNIADNNLFVDCKFAFSFSPWGQGRWEKMIDSPGTRSRIGRGGVDITKPPHITRYPDLAQMRENADRNFIWRNMAINCGQFATRERGVNELLDNCTWPADPGFADAARRNFALGDTAPIYDRLPFRPIPFAEIGLYHDEFRATWPVEHAVTPHYFREY